MTALYELDAMVPTIDECLKNATSVWITNVNLFLHVFLLYNILLYGFNYTDAMLNVLFIHSQNEQRTYLTYYLPCTLL